MFIILLVNLTFFIPVLHFPDFLGFAHWWCSQFASIIFISQ